MKKFILPVVLFLALTGCKCSVEKQAVTQVESSHKLIAVQLLKYVDADQKLSSKDKADWKALIASDERNVEALKKSLE